MALSERSASALKSLLSFSLIHPVLKLQIYNAVLVHAKAERVVAILHMLKTAYLINGARGEDNCIAVLEHPNLDDFYTLITQLKLARLLNQNTFSQLIQYSPVLFSDPLHAFWSQIPSQQWTEERFQAMMMICQNEAWTIEERQREVMRYITHVCLGILEQAPAAINHGQSTHTTSVHVSVSASAKKLMTRYGEHMITQEQRLACLTMLQQRIAALESHPKNDAAKRCLTRISAVDYVYEDSVSHVSLHQLLVMSALVIQDESALSEMHSNPGDAFKALVQGLYEIQRGYNLNETEIDDGLDDSPICLAGTFNKLINCLQGIHPDYMVLVKTKATALAKLGPVIKETGLSYLTEVQKKITKEEFLVLLTKVQEEHILPIWETIKGSVYGVIHDEFGDLLSESEIDVCIDSIELDLSSFQEASQPLVSIALSESPHGLFAHAVGALSEDSAPSSTGTPTHGASATE